VGKSRTVSHLAFIGFRPPKRLAFGNIDRLVFTALYRAAPGVLDALKITADRGTEARTDCRRQRNDINEHAAGFRRVFFRPSIQRAGGGFFDRLDRSALRAQRFALAERF
jgi:hypothetical protein